MLAKPKKEQRQYLYPPANDRRPHKAQEYRQSMGLQSRGQQLVQGARFCSCVGGQLADVDCSSTFAPVCKIQSIRMVLSIAAEYNLECWQLGYNTAFLNANVTEESLRQDGTRIERVRRERSPNGHEAFEKPA